MWSGRRRSNGADSAPLSLTSTPAPFASARHPCSNPSSSLPGLTRQSIPLALQLGSEVTEWMPGSSPGMTDGAGESAPAIGPPSVALYAFCIDSLCIMRNSSSTVVLLRAGHEDRLRSSPKGPRFSRGPLLPPRRSIAMPESEAEQAAPMKEPPGGSANRKMTARVFDPVIAAGAAAYARARDLPKLFALSPHELADDIICRDRPHRSEARVAGPCPTCARPARALVLRSEPASRSACGAESRAGPSRPSSQRAGLGAARGGGGMNRLLLVCAFLFLLWRICAPAEPDISPARDSAVFPAVQEARR